MDEMQDKLTDEVLIQEFNSELISTPKIAEKYKFPLNIVKNRVRRLQLNGTIGFKDRSGKVVTKPGDPSPRAKKKKKRKYVWKDKKEEFPVFEKVSAEDGSKLEDLLKNTNEEEPTFDQSISAYHKELLIELLHKLIC